MQSDTRIRDISLHVKTLANNVDFLNIDSQFEYTNSEFNVEVDIENPIFKLGMCFSNTKELKEVVRNYAIKNGRQMRFIENTPNRLRAMCSNVCD